MTTAADQGSFPGAGPDPAGHPGRMRTSAQIVGGVVLGLGLASAVGLDPGGLFAAYTAGLGLALLCIGLLLPAEAGTAAPAASGRPAEPPAAAGPLPRPRPPHHG
jgi:hypothetical protein